MPYLTEQDRKKWGATGYFPKTPGELNYHITQVLVEYAGEDYNYARLNEIIGVLECAKQEFYRRVVASYEIQKCFENGDVY